MVEGTEVGILQNIASLQRTISNAFGGLVDYANAGMATFGAAAGGMAPAMAGAGAGSNNITVNVTVNSIANEIDVYRLGNQLADIIQRSQR
jgi:hypothetical protein